jgi:sugar phosphate permease
VIAATASYTVALLVLVLGTRLDSIAIVIVALVATGASFGHAQPPLLTIAANAVPSEHFGLAPSLQQCANQIGAVVGMSLLSAVVADSTDAGPFIVAYLIGSGAVTFASVVARACSTRPVDECRAVERDTSGLVLEA